MIIDSPIISGSYAATGSLNQTGDVVITGSLTVTGTINGSITGSITTASYALNAETLDGLDSTSFVTTSSFNTASGSFSTRVTNLESFSSSLDATFATDAQLAAVSQSLSSSLSIVSGSLSSRVANNEATGSSLTTASGSFSTRVTNNEATGSSLVTASGSFSTRTTNLETASGSFSTRVTNTEATASSLVTASGSFSTRVTNTEATASSLTTASSSFSTRVTNTEVTASSLVTASGSFSTRTTDLEIASGSFSTRVTSAEGSITSLNSRTGSYATTGSNIFIGNQTITGSLTITENLTVLGSSSISYVSQSTLNIGTNLITVNAQNPSIRFGGLAVIDSGSSPQVSGSWLFDSIQNRWIFIHQQTAGGAVTSSIGIMGPETYNSLGSETQLTLNRLTKGVAGASGEHIGDSQITDDGTTVTIPGRLTVSTSITGSLFGTASWASNAVTSSYILNAVSASFATSALTSSFVNTLNQNVIISGSLTVFTGSAVELQVTNTGVTLGNAISDTHNVTGSLRVSGSIIAGTANVARGTAFTSPFLTNGGNLATTAGSTVRLGSLSFDAGGNGVGLGVYGLRQATGSSWTTTGIKLQLDVDNSTDLGGNLFISSNGNVGIGTTNPTVELDVVSSGGSGMRIIDSTSPNFYINNTSVQWKIYLPASSNDFRINDAVGDYVTIRYNSGNVGIGTTNPLSRLHINTGTNQNLRIRPGTDVSAANGIAINSRDDADATLQQLSLRASDVLMLVTGNVGIGTTSPDALFSIANTSGQLIHHVFATVTLGANSTWYRVAQLNNNLRSDIELFISTIFGGAFGSTRVRISSLTRTIQAEWGNVNGGYSIRGVRLASESGIVYLEILSNETSPAVTITSSYIRGTGFTPLAFTSAAGSTSISAFLFADYGNNNGGGFIGTVEAGSTYNYSIITSNVERLRVTSDGNVLIGTTNTGADGLNINNQRNLSFAEGSGESYANVFRQRNTAATVVSSGYKRSLTGLFASSFSSAMARAAIAVGYNNGSIAFFTDPSSTVANGTDITPNERVTILNNGNVGIGTTSPGYNLDISGTTTTNLRLTDSGDVGFQMTSGGSSNAFSIRTNSSTVVMSTSNSRPLSIGVNSSSGGLLASTTGMTITSGGNVGIGTSPNNRLHVNSNVNTTGYAAPGFGNGHLRLNPANQGPGDMILEIGAHNSPAGLYWIQTFNVGSPTAAGGNLILQPSAGNVGIGTTSPATTLDVNGNTTVRGSLAFKTTGTNNGNLIISDNGGGTATINNSANSFLNIASASSTSITAGNFIVSGGNVGIGTTNPSTILDVRGGLTLVPSTSLPYENIGDNPFIRRYVFNNGNMNAGQKIRLTNTTSIAGRSSAMFFIKVHQNQLISDAEANHAYAIFSFRVRIGATGGTPTIQGLTTLASYGWNPSTDFTFTGSSGGTFTLDFTQNSGFNLGTLVIDMEMLGAGSGAAHTFSGTFTQTTI